MKFAFLDTEFTGEHSKTTLVSLSVVGLGDESLSISFNDYDREQVTPWLHENVLIHIDESKSLSRKEAFPIISRWFEDYSSGELVSLVTAGKTFDHTLLFELWHFDFPEMPYFHRLHCLPPYLNHSAHLDLDTLFLFVGIDPACDREKFIDYCVTGNRHESLYDARVVRECFLRCMALRKSASNPFPWLTKEFMAAITVQLKLD